jgi:hypothetical protein
MAEFVIRSSSNAMAAVVAASFHPDGTAPPVRILPLNGKTEIVTWPPMWLLKLPKPKQKSIR